jgi:hypothetical protein
MNNEIRCQACGHDNSIPIFLEQDPVEWDEYMNSTDLEPPYSYLWCERCYNDRLNLLMDPW